MRDIDLFAKQVLEASVKIGTPQGLGGVSESIEKPEYATAIGLAMLASENMNIAPVSKKKSKKVKSGAKSGGPNFLKKIFSKF